MTGVALAGGPQPEQTRRSIKHITRACEGCRRRKIKCDAAQPQCANCALYREDCTFARQIDKRKVGSKKRISLLGSYALELESLLVHHGVGLPLSRPDYLLPPTSSVSSSAVVSDSTTGNSEVADASQRAAPATDPKICTAPTESSPSTSDSGNALPNTPRVMNPLSDRSGSLQIAEDGQLRFFGPTSNLHISHVGPFPLFNSNIRTIHGNESLILRAANVDYPVDEELENHLTKLYFAWENPNIPIVDEGTYYQEKARYRKYNLVSHRYSEVLTNAICAIGAALTTRYRSDLPESLVEFFATRSKALLEVEMDSPTLSTVQSLGILSGVEALLTRDARGWLYSGMAMRLAIDLGIHIDATPFAEKGFMNIDEVRLRAHVFWGIYVHDRMWSQYTGRPESIDNLDITVPLPVPGGCHAIHKEWCPYIDDDHPVTKEYPALLDEVFRETVALCRTMGSVRKALYSAPKDTSPGIEKLYALAKESRAELDAWVSKLPENLTIDVDSSEGIYLPHIVQMHMQYHAIRIIVERPFLSLPAHTGIPARQDMERSREACYDAACAISSLVQKIRRHFSLRRINIQTVHHIFTAMLVHVHNACLSEDYQLRNASYRHLEICSQALAEIGQAYKNALRALEIITSIKSDLTKHGKRGMRSDLNLAGQVDFMNTGADPDHMPSALSTAETSSSQMWPVSLSSDEGPDRIGSMTTLDFESQFVPTTTQMLLSGQWTWGPFGELFLT